MANKSGALSKVELFYIEGNRGDKTPEEIADDLGRSIPLIEKTVAELPELVAEPPKMATAGDMMGRTTVGGSEDYGVSIMTPGASEHADEHRKNRAVLSPKAKKSIFVPNPDKKCR